MREHKGYDDSATFDACTIIMRITSSNESEPTTSGPSLWCRPATHATQTYLNPRVRGEGSRPYIESNLA